jgi:hypothetical protein
VISGGVKAPTFLGDDMAKVLVVAKQTGYCNGLREPGGDPFEIDGEIPSWCEKAKPTGAMGKFIEEGTRPAKSNVEKKVTPKVKKPRNIYSDGK